MEFFFFFYNLGTEEVKQDYLQQIGFLGFYNLDTFQPMTYDEYSKSGWKYLYWKKDTLQTTYMISTDMDDRYKQRGFRVKKSSSSDPTNCCPIGDPFVQNYGGWGSGIIFLPLLNGGFVLINNICYFINNQVVFDPAPTFHPQSIAGIDYGRHRCSSYFIGIPPTNNINNWVYLYGGGPLSYPNVSIVSTPRQIDFQKGRLIDNTVYGETIAENSLDYSYNIDYKTSYDSIDINPNVCTLIKMPYNNGFMDNLYLMSTAPSQIKYYSFFSFGGRNFLNLVDNIVVELPNN